MILFENMKYPIVTEIEMTFGDLIYSQEKDYTPTQGDLEKLFDIINRHIFGNELNRGIKKRVVTEKEEPALKDTMAAFGFGMVKGQPTELIMMKHPAKDNFFVTACSLIHEMIHMYDYNFGKMRTQIDKYGTIGVFNWNYPSPDPSVNAVNALKSGMHPEQLPQELKQQMDLISKTHRAAGEMLKPRQFQFPARPYPYRDPKDGRMKLGSIPLPKKYTMDDLDGFYDVHGQYFQQHADRANMMGFDITDVFDPRRPHALRLDEDPDEDPIELRHLNADDVVKHLFDSIKAEHKFMTFEDPGNWLIEIQ